MKQCPTCSRTYADESLSYCLDDGALLSASYEPEETQRIPAARATDLVTEALPARQSPTQPTRGGKPLIVYALVGLLALLAGGAIVAWVKWDSPSAPTVRDGAPGNAPSSPGAKDALEEERARLERERQQLALEKERQQLAEERRKLEEQKREASTPADKQPPEQSGETWLVFLGSFTRDEYEKARERLQQVRGLGYDARIIDTDEYPNLTGGLWAVVMGPYSRARAESQAARVKSLRPDAYIKSGW
jgi:cell division septation protein DedD